MKYLKLKTPVRSAVEDSGTYPFSYDVNFKAMGIPHARTYSNAVVFVSEMLRGCVIYFGQNFFPCALIAVSELAAAILNFT